MAYKGRLVGECAGRKLFRVTGFPGLWWVYPDEGEQLLVSYGRTILKLTRCLDVERMVLRSLRGYHQDPMERFLCDSCGDLRCAVVAVDGHVLCAECADGLDEQSSQTENGAGM